MLSERSMVDDARNGGSQKAAWESDDVCTLLARHYKLPVKDIQVYVLGEHGDTQVVPWSLISVKGKPIEEFPDFAGMKDNLFEELRTAGAKIIANKGATFYAVSLSVTELCKTIIQDLGFVHTVSAMLKGEYGITDVCLSLPFIVNGNGIKELFEVKLTSEEEKLLHKSANALKEFIASLAI